MCPYCSAFRSIDRKRLTNSVITISPDHSYNRWLEMSRLGINPRPGRGGGVDATPLLRFFCDAPRTMSRIVLKFCIAYGASFAQLLVNFFDQVMSGDGAMTSQEVQNQYILREIAEYGTLEGDIEASFDYFRSELTCMTPPPSFNRLVKVRSKSRSRSGQWSRLTSW